MTSSQTSNQIKNVAIVGAAGQLGKHITAALLKTGKHNVTAITRLDSQSTFPDRVTLAKVNYDDNSSLVNALRGQDALVITMKATAPKDSVTKLVEAGIEAQIPWILPNEWGGDYTDHAVNHDVMLGADKLAIRDLITTKGSPNTSMIAVACGFWYDYSLAAGTTTFGFDFDHKNATFYDDGALKMYYSTLPYCGQAVANLLSLPVASTNKPNLSTYRNQIVRVHAFHLSQHDMLASILRVTGDNESDWTVTYKSSESRYKKGMADLKNGDRRGYRQLLYARAFYPSNARKTDEDYADHALGLVPPQLDVVTQWCLENAEGN